MLRWSCQALVSSLCLVALSTLAVGDPLPDPRDPSLGPEERFQALAERANLAQSQLRTLQAQFVQRKESEVLLEPEISRGTLYFIAPDRLRWDFTTPGDTVVVVRGEEMLTWYRDLDRAERVRVGSRANRLLRFLGPNSSLEDLQRYFSVNAAFPKDPTKPYRLELEPRISRLGKRIREMILHLDPELYIPVHLYYAEPGGQTTELDFEDIQINGEISNEYFEFDLPKHVEVRVVDLGN